jgi:aminopeptidase N
MPIIPRVTFGYFQQYSTRRWVGDISSTDPHRTVPVDRHRLGRRINFFVQAYQRIIVAKEPVEKHLVDYRPPAFLVESIALIFDLTPEATRVRAESRLRRNPAHDETAAPLTLFGDSLKLLTLQIDGNEPAERLEDGERLKITDVPDAFTLLVETEIAPVSNTRLEGLYLSNGTFCTQCEAEGFRRITWFPDRPDVMTTYRVTIRADKKKQPVLLSNGNLEDSGELADGRH